MSDNMFEARRDIQKQLKAKFPDMGDRDCEVLADMTVKFGDDLNELMMRTLTTFTPLMNGLEASMVAPICLSDASVQLGMSWKQSAGRCIAELRDMARQAMDDRNSGGGRSFMEALLDKLASVRGEKE